MAGMFSRRVLTAACVGAMIFGLPGRIPTAGADVASGTEPLSCVPAVGTPQVVLPLPGLFLPLPSIKGVSEFGDLPLAPAEVDLPERVDFRDNTQGFNSEVDAVLRNGSVYVRPHNFDGAWRKVHTPDCLDGGIVGISVDNNMLVALDANGWIYSLDNLLSGPMLWNWSRSFGAPIWLWPGMKVPGDPLATNKWSISHRMSKSFKDAEGTDHPTTAGLVQLVSLTGDGSRIVYQDPWLPADYSYEIGGPEGGRFISESISTSGSVTVVMNRFGDMYTRKYDLDMAGANHIPGRYTWQPGEGKPSAPNQLLERVDPQYAAISLPAEDWQKQPKIPGEVSSLISIVDTGPTAENRELRVEGRSAAGSTGVWHKDLSATQWEFTATGDPLRMPILPNDPTVDQSALTLAKESETSFSGVLPRGWQLDLPNFDWAQTKHRAVLHSPTGRTYEVQMYTTDELRLIPRGPGLDNNPRGLEGALDVRSADPWGSENSELAGFVSDNLGGQSIFELTIRATSERLLIARLHSVLSRY